MLLQGYGFKWFEKNRYNKYYKSRISIVGTNFIYFFIVNLLLFFFIITVNNKKKKV